VPEPGAAMIVLKSKARLLAGLYTKHAKNINDN